MAYIRIHCDECGGAWEIYSRDDLHATTARQCPHCYSRISSEVWENSIIPAAMAAQDANTALIKDALGYRRPLFSVDLISNHLFTKQPALKVKKKHNPYANCPNLD